MPTLGQLQCNVVWRGSDVELAEYETHYQDGIVTTFVPVPPHPTRFQVRLRSYGTILWGLAMFIFIDGEYQCNRNGGHKVTDIELRCSHKETDMADGRFFRAPWKFERIKQASEGDSSPSQAPFDGECVGAIEIVVLRLASSDRAIPSGLPPSNPTAQFNRPLWSGGDGVQDERLAVTADFGLDGSHDEPERRHSVHRRRPKNDHRSSKPPDPLSVQNHYNFFFGGVGAAPTGVVQPYIPGPYNHYHHQRRSQAATSSSSDSSGGSKRTKNPPGPSQIPPARENEDAGEATAQVSTGWAAGVPNQAPGWNQAPARDSNRPFNDVGNVQDNSSAQWVADDNQHSHSEDLNQFFSSSPPDEPNSPSGNGGGWAADNQVGTGGWNEANTKAKDNEDNNNATGWGGDDAQGGASNGWGGDDKQGTPSWSNQPGGTGDSGGWGASTSQPDEKTKPSSSDENDRPQWSQSTENPQTSNQVGGWGGQEEGWTGNENDKQAPDENDQAQNDNVEVEEQAEGSEVPQRNTPIKEPTKKTEEVSIPSKFACDYERRPQPYWEAWREAALKGAPAPLAIFDPHVKAPIYSLREDVVQRNNITHQVAVSRARQVNPHPELQSTPKYLDDPDHPFAVFVFRYRDEETLSKLLDRDVRETPAQEAKRVMGLSKEKIAEYYMRKEGHEPPPKIEGPAPSARSGPVASASPPHFTQADLYTLNNSFNRSYPSWPAPYRYEPGYKPGEGSGHVRHRGLSPPERYPREHTYTHYRPSGEHYSSNSYRRESPPPPAFSGEFSNASNTTNDNLDIALRNMNLNQEQTRPMPPRTGPSAPVGENRNSPPPTAQYGPSSPVGGYGAGWRSAAASGYPWRIDGRGYDVYDPGHPRGRQHPREFIPQEPRS